jgi:hypothetical protein
MPRESASPAHRGERGKEEKEGAIASILGLLVGLLFVFAMWVVWQGFASFLIEAVKELAKGDGLRPSAVLDQNGTIVNDPAANRLQVFNLACDSVHSTLSQSFATAVKAKLDEWEVDYSRVRAESLIGMSFSFTFFGFIIAGAIMPKSVASLLQMGLAICWGSLSAVLVCVHLLNPILVYTLFVLRGSGPTQHALASCFGNSAVNETATIQERVQSLSLECLQLYTDFREALLVSLVSSWFLFMFAVCGMVGISILRSLTQKLVELNE